MKIFSDLIIITVVILALMVNYSNISTIQAVC